MKPKSALRSFLALAGSSILAVSSSHGQTILADSYLTSLDVSSPTTLYPTGGFPSFMVGALTGSSDLTIAGYFTQTTGTNGTVSFTNNGAGNTFSGNIIVDSGTLRIAGSPFASNGGFTAPSMTSSNTITIKRAGILNIDDNIAGGYTANRFGTASRPAVNLAGGTINLNGLNNATSSVQTLGALTVSSGVGAINVTRNSNGNPTLTFASLAISKGALLNVNGTNLGTGTNDARITFTSAPTPTSGILSGVRFWDGGNNAGEFATYGANGVRSFTAADYTDFATDINGATSTQNVRITSAVSPAAALTADLTVNSLNYSAVGGWNMTNKLTIVSGMFLKAGANSALGITSGTLTAGTGSAIDLHMIAGIQNINMTTTSVIADNGVSGVVTLVKSGDRDMSLTSASNNTYSGGTYVLDGTLTTGTTANTRYLGSGKATVDGKSVGGNTSYSTLTLGNIGATSNSTGDDYTAINGGKINIASGANGAYTATDTFNIGTNSFIGGGSASGQGLASLTRGTNITLASGAIIAHNSLSTTLGATNTIQNLGTGTDLFYGLNANQTSAAGAITIGSGTAFRGISTDRSDREWQLGTINIASGTTSVDFQGYASLPNAVNLTLGNVGTAGGPVIAFAGTGTVDIKAIGRVTLNDTAATYGDTTANKNVRFVATAGSTLTVLGATGMGSGTGIASALVQNGGTLTMSTTGNAAALNGAVTVEAGGRLIVQQAAGLTGTGALTFNEGSILEISSQALAFSGSQATAATINAGTLIKLGVTGFGSSSETLDSILGSGSKNVSYIYQGSGDAANPAAAGTAVYTLNKSLVGGKGGVLTNDAAAAPGATRTIGNLTNGQINIGANGGVFAATTNSTLTVNENSVLSGNLEIGTTAIIDGAPKLGNVTIGGGMDMNGATRTITTIAGTGTLQITGVISNGGLTKAGAGTLIVTTAANTYAGGTTVDAGTLQLGNVTSLGSTSGQLTVNTGGTLNMSAVAQTVGNLTGTGGIINAAGRLLTIGQGNTGGGDFQGSIQGASGALTKTGTGTITLSGNNTYTGVTTVSGGVLKLNHATALSGGIGAAGGTSALTINGGGVVGLANGDFSRGLGTGVTQVNLSGASGGGFAAYGVDRTVNLGGAAAGVTWNTGSFVTTGNSLVLSAADADRTLIFANPIALAGAQRTVQVNNGSAAIDARLSGALTGTTSSGLNKTGAGTLEITGTGHTYAGATTVTDGKLIVNANISTSSLTTVAVGATLGGSGTVGKTVVNGTLSVGNSPGQMTVTDTLTLTGITITEIDGTSGAGVAGGHDFVNLTGAGAAGVLTYGGTMTLDMGILFGVGSYSWNLFDMASETGTFTGITLADQYTGSLLDVNLDGVWDLTSGSNTWQFTESTGVLGLTVAAIPEPGAALIGSLGLLALLRRRR